MDFKVATDEILAGMSHEELARELRVSVPSVRQARLAKEAKAHRAPPEGWEPVVIRLAKRRISHLVRLVERLQGL